MREVDADPNSREMNGVPNISGGESFVQFPLEILQ
jgi:hypothetical protein